MISNAQALEVFGGKWGGREADVLYPRTDIQKDLDVEKQVLQAFTKLAFDQNGARRTVGMVDGAFDVGHSNHDTYLKHCKLVTIEHQLIEGGYEPTIEELKLIVQNDFQSLGSRAMLALTLDSDERINYKKSGKAEKGGVQRPIYPWEARAERILNQNYQGVNIVDLVTTEGDSIHEGTPLERFLTLAKFLHDENLLNFIIIFGEHSDVVDEADNLRLPFKVISSDSDQQLGYRFGTYRLRAV